MYFISLHEHSVRLKASYLDPTSDLRQNVLSNLRETLNGRYCEELSSVVVHVREVHELGREGIIDDTGSAEFTAKFTAVICKPFEGEVLEAEVYFVHAQGFCAKAGPISIRVDRAAMPSCYVFSRMADKGEYNDPRPAGRATVRMGSAVRLRLLSVLSVRTSHGVGRGVAASCPIECAGTLLTMASDGAEVDAEAGTTTGVVTESEYLGVL